MFFGVFQIYGFIFWVLDFRVLDFRFYMSYFLFLGLHISGLKFQVFRCQNAAVKFLDLLLCIPSFKFPAFTFKVLYFLFYISNFEIFGFQFEVLAFRFQISVFRAERWKLGELSWELGEL